MKSALVNSPVVITFPFSIFPVSSGGALRGFYLLRELARAFEVDALVVDHPEEIEAAIHTDLGSELVGLRVFQIASLNPGAGLLTRIGNRVRTFAYTRSLTVSTNSTMLATAELLEAIVSDRKPFAVILTNLESWICAAMLGRLSTPTRRIIDMYNLEHELRSQLVESVARPPARDPEVSRLESETANLFRYAHGLFACSDDDRDELAALNGQRIPCATIPNGVACDKALLDDRNDKFSSKRIIFCGSLSYPPNIDGLNWFFRNIWPTVSRREPHARLDVVGRGFRANDYPGIRDDPTINLIGEVDQVMPYYRRAGISICPLRMGSGTRLKILESMSFGNPTVSTSIGCAGLAVEDGTHISIRDDSDAFADAICSLMKDQAKFDLLRRNARRLVVEQYDWKIIGKRLVEHVVSIGKHSDR